MINCNPETVSTDYDTSDKLYFEPLTLEDILEIVKTEQKSGKTVRVNYSIWRSNTFKTYQNRLEKYKIPIIGTTPDSIDLAEDRERFKKFLLKLKLKQPE